MKKEKNEKGVAIVEAAIYMPLVLCTVMALLYLALFNMQEYMMMYQVHRVANVVAREEAYLGYEAFGMGADNEIDFPAGGVPSGAQIDNYYQEHFNSLSNLYREIGGVFSAFGGVTHANGGRFSDAAANSTLIALGSISEPQVEVDSGFLGAGITVTITHALPVPGVLKYLGYDKGTTIRTAAYSYSVNPSAFVRNVDLASDAVAYILEKFHLDGSFHSLMGKVNEVLDVIL